ncbi:tyrosine-type recombinase/integrase [Sphingomonas sp. Leaf10]|uniref:tyrosine-type recombinase/integrase n=1 Tax=Sphingomonas sp. Leaf10 TaxID=1735676 RepID=UPI0009E9E8BD|nr:tyrosine-type recombinase/integrase [Sphingomonas sp. Leaf10]
MPIHSQLIQLGFLDYVNSRLKLRNDKGDARLFPEFDASSRGQIGGIPSRFWRNYLERIGVKEGADGFGSHSFRHGLTDRLRLAGYLDDEIEVALGHNQISVTAGYGTVRQGTVERIAGMLEKVSFPVKLPA